MTTASAKVLYARRTAGFDDRVAHAAAVLQSAALDHAGYDLLWSPPPPGGWLGVGLRGGERIVVDTVREDGPSCGVLSPGDEILALADDRVVGGELGDRLKETAPGTVVPVMIARDGRVRRTSVTVAANRRTDLKITERPAIDDRRRRVRSAWLSRTDPPAHEAKA